MKLKNKNQKGQSLFEVVLALGVVTAITVGIVALTANAIKNASFSKNKTLAGKYSQEGTEWLRSERDTDFTIFSQNAQTPLWCFASLSWTQPGTCASGNPISGTQLFRDATFSTNLVSGKTVIDASVRVYWTDSQGAHEVRSATSFSDWRQR